MVTKAEAMTAEFFHFTGKHPCTRTVGPRGGVKVRVTACRRSGRTQTWKTRPEEFRVPVKYGMFESGEITHRNASEWHTVAACPLDNTEEN